MSEPWVVNSWGGDRIAWLGTARLLKVREEYEGTWSDEFFVPLRKMLDDMLEEAAPRIFGEDEILAESTDVATTPVKRC